MRKLWLGLFLSCWATLAAAQQPAFRTIQSSQDPTGPLGLLTNLGGGQEIDLINGPSTATDGFRFYQTGNNNVRSLLFDIGLLGITVPGLGGGGTQCLQVNNAGVISGLGSGCGVGISQLTGDVTAGPGSGSQVATLATVNSNVGSFGSTTQCATFTVNGKGLITAASQGTCAPAVGSISGLGTGIAAALGVNVGSAGAPILFNGAGGTPSSLTLTNATGLQTTSLLGTLQAAQEPAHTGDCTNTAGSLAITCLLTNGAAFTTTAVAPAGQLPGEPSTGSASTGKVGEYIESVIPTGSAVSLVTGTAKTVTSISLTAGDWDVDTSAYFNSGGTTVVTSITVGISLTTNTLDTTAGRWAQLLINAAAGPPTTMSNVPPYRLSLSTTTTVFMIAQSGFTTSTQAAWGIIRARRAR